MLSNKERNELTKLVQAAQECLDSNFMTPLRAYELQEHGETLVELERMRRLPAYSPALQGCEA